MAGKHAYVTSPGQLIEVLDQLKKSFPQNLTADVLKKLSLASSNEGAVINTIRFLSLIDDQNARTDKGQKVFTLHDPDAFKSAFADIVRSAYSELFTLHGDAAWDLDQGKLVTFFRQADQSTARVGQEQARTFKTLANYAGYGESTVQPKPRVTNRGEKPKLPKNQKMNLQPSQQERRLQKVWILNQNGNLDSQSELRLIYRLQKINQFTITSLEASVRTCWNGRGVKVL